MSSWNGWNSLIAEENRIESPNKNSRGAGVEQPTHIVIHITGTNDYATVKNRFTDSAQQASAHYLVKKDGSLVQFVKDCDRAWHAGVKSYIKNLYDAGDGNWKKYLRYFSWYQGYPANAVYVKSDLTPAQNAAQRALVKRNDGADWPHYCYWSERHGDAVYPVNYTQNTDPNSYSIGIELLTTGGSEAEKYASGLYDGLAILLKDLCSTYSIPRDSDHIIGHEDVNPVERWGWDPNSGFDWKRVFDSIKENNSFSLPLDITGLDTKLEPTRNALNEYYIHTEQEFVGGYFPVGANTTWHGGIHLEGAEGMPVHAMADGVVVCARMPAADAENDKAIYGSRNFALVRHGESDNIWYSLYYHLKSIAMDSEEAKKIAWLSGPAFKLKTNVNIRNVPKDQPGTKVLRTAQTGETIEVISADEDGWYWVFDPQGKQNGYMKYSPDWMDRTSAVSADLADKLSAGSECYQIERQIKAGDIIGYVGKGLVYEGDKIVESNLIHWQVFSPKLLDGRWETAEDGDADYRCNSEALIKLIDENRDAKLTRKEIADYFADEEKAKAIRRYACRFQSEWSVEWDSFAGRMKKEGIRASAKTLALYNFWEQATGADSALPDDGKVWHYNPIAFLEIKLFTTARATFLADCFEPDRTLPLPGKVKPLLKKIGMFASESAIQNALIIAHAGGAGDTRDSAELCDLRGKAFAALLTASREKVGSFFDADEWDVRERKVMISYFKKADGARYYTGGIDDENTAELTDAVKAFQGDNGLGVDGAAGPQTFTKMFELLLAEADFTAINECAVVAANANHPEETSDQADAQPAAEGGEEKHEVEPGRLVEVMLWPDEIEPKPDSYGADSAAVYGKWVSLITREIRPAAPLGDGEAGIEIVRTEDDALFEDEEFEIIPSEGEPFRVRVERDQPDLLRFKNLPQTGTITLIRYPGAGIEPHYIFKDVDVAALTEEDPDIEYSELEAEKQGD